MTYSKIKYAFICLFIISFCSPGVCVRLGSPGNAAAATLGSETEVPRPTLAEVRYGEHERQVIDVWQAESNRPTPLAFVIHGGGWTGGSKERVARFVDIERLLDAGISVAAINYRYVSQARDAGVEPPVKLPLYDAARALQFIRSKASEWHIDKTRIGAAGGSAGACSSLWLAYHDDLADPTSSDPMARESTRLQCAAVIGAQTTLDPRQMKEWTPNSRYGGHAFGKRNFEQFLADRESILPWIAEYSPYALVTPDDPPVCLLYSTPPALGQVQKDPTHTSNFGVKLQEKCMDVGVPCEFVYTADADTRHILASDFLIKTLKALAGPTYKDGRPAATLRMDTRDQGIVLRYGDGPDGCDRLGARDVWVFEEGGTYYMHYDAAGPRGWLCSLAVSTDLVTWEKKGPILDFGAPGEDDSKSASYGVTYKDGSQWHMFYLGTPNVSPKPNLVPSFPYLTMKAKANGPAGPWIKQKDVIPFRTKPNTYYSITASPGQVIRHEDEYLQ
ncbi:MAG: alpha/beta hydrolase fold domain-containing protein, partial [Phycisphaerae bacterium]|nr:alpha/beta hydrolase fold domain-containing protein [Phycisphaerae bacterium]